MGTHNHTNGPVCFDFHDGLGPVAAHQHPNGLGWVADTAQVGKAVFVGPEARVSGWARVTEDVRLCDHSRVYDYASLGGKVLVRDHASVGGSASLEGEVELCGHCYVGGSSRLNGRAVLGGYETVADFGHCLDCPGFPRNGYGALHKDMCLECMLKVSRRLQREVDIKLLRDSSAKTRKQSE